jgi:hypothetical protein
MYNPGMMPNMMGMGQPMMMGVQPVYRQIAVGAGIDMNEFNTIVKAATNAYMSRVQPLSLMTANAIKQFIGGEWFVFISLVGDNEYNFAMSCVKGADFMSFSLDNTQFQICRIV